MTARSPHWRRDLARALSRRYQATVEDILRAPPAVAGASFRIGITGPPGAGKSSLISRLAQRRLAQGRSVGILAIGPTSPLTGGSVLGDRVRMDELDGHDDLFIRSVPSGPSHDGLCPNVLGLLELFDEAGFDDVILETVGVGQINYAARPLVDVFVLVLSPESGDTVQAMKAGILEAADIYVVNKADMPAAQRLVSELRALARWRAATDAPPMPVIPTSTLDGAGIDSLAAAIDEQRSLASAAARRDDRLRDRRLYQLRTLLLQAMEEALPNGGADWTGEEFPHAITAILNRLGMVFPDANANLRN